MTRSGNEVMKKVTGPNLLEEEGAGLRMNIGIRRQAPDRSRTVAGGAVYMQKSAMRRNRQFNVLGAEVKFSGVCGFG